MSSPFDDVSAVARFYDDLVATHGDHRLAVGWHWSHSQRVNFAQLAALDGLTSGASVLDLGCGLGHFADFLAERGLEVDYTGWDISPAMIAQARERRPELRFEVRDILVEACPERFDFVIACGALSMLLPDHDAWLSNMLRAMFQLCRKGLAFTLLSRRVLSRDPFAGEPDLYYADPASVLAFCLELSPQVDLDHQSLAHSFAVRVYRNNTEPIFALARDLGLSRQYTPAHEVVIEYFRSFFMFAELLEYLESLEPCAAVWDHIGMAAFHLDDSERQIAAFSQALALAPDEVAYAQHLAIAYLHAGRPHDALPVLEQAFALDPDNREIAEYATWARRAIASE